MREFIQSLSSLTLAASLFPLSQLQAGLVASRKQTWRSPTVHAMDAVTSAIVKQLAGSLRSTFQVMDNLQRGVAGMAFGAVNPRGWAPDMQKRRPESSGEPFASENVTGSEERDNRSRNDDGSTRTPTVLITD